MQIRKRYILIAVILLGIAWFLQNKTISRANNQLYSKNLQQLRDVNKLSILEQDFLLHNLDSVVATYPFMADVIVSGKIGLDIDLGDSIRTIINVVKDTLVISAPLQVNYINFDITTIQAIQVAAADQNHQTNQSQVIKLLNTETLKQYLPLITTDLKTRTLFNPEQYLSKLTGVPVKITLTQMPKTTDWQ